MKYGTQFAKRKSSLFFLVLIKMYWILILFFIVLIIAIRWGSNETPVDSNEIEMFYCKDKFMQREAYKPKYSGLFSGLENFFKDAPVNFYEMYIQKKNIDRRKLTQQWYQEMIYSKSFEEYRYNKYDPDLHNFYYTLLQKSYNSTSKDFRKTKYIDRFPTKYTGELRKCIHVYNLPYNFETTYTTLHKLFLELKSNNLTSPYAQEDIVKFNPKKHDECFYAYTYYAQYFNENGYTDIANMINDAMSIIKKNYPAIKDAYLQILYYNSDIGLNQHFDTVVGPDEPTFIINVGEMFYYDMQPVYTTELHPVRITIKPMQICGMLGAARYKWSHGIPSGIPNFAGRMGFVFRTRCNPITTNTREDGAIGALKRMKQRQLENSGIVGNGDTSNNGRDEEYDGLY
jgi:hypothetical protein